VERYRRTYALARAVIGASTASADACAAAWRRRRRTSKLLNFARLAKATFTFDGALDYVLWKVAARRGAGTDWRQRHPLLSAPECWRARIPPGAFLWKQQRPQRALAKSRDSGLVIRR
jgi:hypothetical protein